MVRSCLPLRRGRRRRCVTMRSRVSLSGITRAHSSQRFLIPLWLCLPRPSPHLFGVCAYPSSSVLTFPLPTISTSLSLPFPSFIPYFFLPFRVSRLLRIGAAASKERPTFCRKNRVEVAECGKEEDKKGPSHRGSIPTFSNPSVLSAFAAAAAVAPSSAVCYFRHATLLVSVRLLSSPPRETSLTSHAVCAEKEGMKTFEVLPPPRLIQSEVKKTLSTLANSN